MTPITPELPVEAIAPEHPPEPDRQGLLRRTVLEGAMLFVLSALIGSALQKFNLGIFLASEQNTNGISAVLKLNPLLLVGAGLIAAPILEESLFRGLPYWLCQRFARPPRITARMSFQISWIVGISAALLFAAAHGPGNLPVPQLMVGLWSWHVIRTRGLRYSMLLHAAYNFVPVLMITAWAYYNASQ